MVSAPVPAERAAAEALAASLQREEAVARARGGAGLRGVPEGARPLGEEPVLLAVAEAALPLRRGVGRAEAVAQLLGLRGEVRLLRRGHAERLQHAAPAGEQRGARVVVDVLEHQLRPRRVGHRRGLQRAAQLCAQQFRLHERGEGAAARREAQRRRERRRRRVQQQQRARRERGGGGAHRGGDGLGPLGALVLEEHVPLTLRRRGRPARVHAAQRAVRAERGEQHVQQQRRPLVGAAAVQRHVERGRAGRAGREAARRRGAAAGGRELDGERRLGWRGGARHRAARARHGGHAGARGGEDGQQVSGARILLQQVAPVAARRGREPPLQRGLVEQCREVRDKVRCVVRHECDRAVERDAERRGGDRGEHERDRPLQRGQQLGVDAGGAQDGHHHRAPRAHLSEHIRVAQESERVDARRLFVARVRRAPRPAAAHGRGLEVARLLLLALGPVVGRVAHEAQPQLRLALEQRRPHLLDEPLHRQVVGRRGTVAHEADRQPAAAAAKAARLAAATVGVGVGVDVGVGARRRDGGDGGGGVGGVGGPSKAARRHAQREPSRAAGVKGAALKARVGIGDVHHAVSQAVDRLLPRRQRGGLRRP